MITNSQSGTNIEEVASGIYRINTPIPIPGAGTFNFNQYLVVDEAPLLFHTGQHGLFPLVLQAIESVMPVSRLRYVAFSHFEADECGALNLVLDAAPDAVPLAGMVGARTTIGEYAKRPVCGLRDGERIVLGRHRVSARRRRLRGAQGDRQ